MKKEILDQTLLGTRKNELQKHGMSFQRRKQLREDGRKEIEIELQLSCLVLLDWMDLRKENPSSVLSH